MTLEDRAQHFKAMRPQSIAELTLFPREQSTRKTAVQPGWGCLCFRSRTAPANGWDGHPNLDEPLELGSTRVVGFIFLSGEEAVQALSARPSFFLWERGFIGEGSSMTAKYPNF